MYQTAAIPINFEEIPVLPKPEQDELAVQAKHGNDDAGRRLIRSNLKLIALEAHHLSHRYHAELWDLIAAGVRGMDEAIDRYVAESGHFIHYAMHYVKMRMRREAMTARIVRIPYNAFSQLAAVRNGSREATPRDLRRAAAIHRAQNIVAMHEHTFAGGPTYCQTIEDDATPTPAAAAAQVLDLEVIAPALATLDDRRRKVIILRYGLDGQPPMTLCQIAPYLRLTRERIRQLEHSALARLRAYVTTPPAPEAQTPPPTSTEVYLFRKWYIAKMSDGTWYPLTRDLKPRARTGARWLEIAAAWKKVVHKTAYRVKSEVRSQKSEVRSQKSEN